VRDLALVFLGGGLGAVARYALHAAISRYGATFPWGTLTVNLFGCLLMGSLLAYSANLGMKEEWRLFLTVGLLGGFTTFSAFSGESLALLQKGEVGTFALYATLSLAGCILASFVGYALAARVLP